MSQAMALRRQEAAGLQLLPLSGQRAAGEPPAAGRRLLIPKNFLPSSKKESKKSFDRSWAGDMYPYRYIFNRSASAMHNNGDDLTDYMVEGKGLKKEIDKIGKEALESEVLQFVTNAAKYQICLDGQVPINDNDVIKTVSSDEWWSKVNNNAVAEEALAMLAVGLFNHPNDGWVERAEKEWMRKHGIAGYETRHGDREERGSVAVVLKRAASDSWKARINNRLEKLRGFRIGARDESAGPSGVKHHYEKMERLHFVAYKITKKADYFGSNGGGGNIETLKCAVSTYLRNGGMLEEVEDVIQDLRRNGGKLGSLRAAVIDSIKITLH